MLVGACFMVVGAGLYVFGEQTIAPLSFAPGTIMFAAMQYVQFKCESYRYNRSVKG